MVNIDKLYFNINNKYQNIFNLNKNTYYDYIINKIYENKEKEKINLFSKILLNNLIDINRILYLINRYLTTQYKSSKYDIKLSYILVVFLTKLNKKELEMNKKEILSIEYENYIDGIKTLIKELDLIKNDKNFELGFYVGVLLKNLSYSINNIDVQIINNITKTINNNKESVIKILNKIGEKASYHIKSNTLKNFLVSNITLTYDEIKEFDKEKFIFGLIFGANLYIQTKNNKKDNNE